ncbi:MAG: hypothetical protein P8Y60_04255 [Calditrichota bacterium]
MNLEEFKLSLSDKLTPINLNDLLRALWFEAKGDWNAAHFIAQENSSNEGSWAHAYLHRKEGDLSNASYCYSRVGRKRPEISLQQEWDNIVSALLSKSIDK